MKSFAAIFLVVLSLLGAGCGDGLAERLKAEGVQTEASIAFKREVGNGRSRNYSFTLYYFAKDSAAIAKEKAQTDILKDSTLSMIDRLDKWEPGAGGIGTFMSVDLGVSGTEFDQYREGERVKIRYLPSDPKQVMLEDQL